MEPTTFTTDTLPPGSRLQNFRIVRMLGRGGFGVIYLATDVSLGHRVAVKEYLPSEIASRTGDSRVRPKATDHEQLYQWGLDRFVKEARNLVRFRHPNIVRVSALFQENNTAYMVMDFEEGQSLRDYVREPEHRTEANLKALIKPIALGLSEVHRQGFIHRDIKPSNLLVRDSGSPVLLDFGSARLASRHATHGLTALVSSGYAPLEQYNPESEEQQGPWSDIYALGGVLYHCISQKDPAESTQRSSSLVNGQRDPMQSASSLGKGQYSDGFLRAIDWALSVRIADRPQMLGDWIPALFATGAQPDATLTTQRLLDQQTRLASPASNTNKPTVATGRPRNEAIELTALDDEKNWDKAVAAAEHRAADDYQAPNYQSPHRSNAGTKQSRQNVASAPRERRAGFAWFFGFAALALIAVVAWFGYQQLMTSLESQKLAVSAQRQAADEALAKAELARQEAIAVIAAQREREAEQIRQGAERLLAERDAEREAERNAEQQRLAAEAAANEQAAAKEKAAKEAEEAEAARLAKAQRDSENAARAAQLREQAEAAKARRDAANRNRQNSLLDEAAKALAQNNVYAAEEALKEARTIGIANSRLQVVAVALQSAQENAREPISDSEFDLIVGEFHELKEAIEQGNIAKVDRLTQGDEQLALFARLIERFERLEVSITGIRARDLDKSVVGTLRINRMIRSNGNRATPSPSYEDRKILSRRINGEWSSIVW